MHENDEYNLELINEKKNNQNQIQQKCKTNPSNFRNVRN